MSVAEASGSEEWRRGWQLVLACFVGFSFFSIMTAALGVFMAPLGEEFGWSRTLLSAGVSIASVATAILSPFVGALIDRFGSRRVAMPGLVVTIFAMCLFSSLNGSPTQWLFLWGFYAVISITVKTTVWTAAVAGAFDAARGLALGVTLAGNAAAQILVPPLATWLVQDFGWRIAYLALCGGWGLITLLLCFFFLRDVKPRDGVQTAKGIPDRSAIPGLTISAALRSRAVWFLYIVSFVSMVFVIGLVVHQIPILTAVGVSATNAAWLASLAGVAGIVGKLVCGALLDRFDANLVGGVTIAAISLAFLLLLYGAGSVALIIVGMIINGYGVGSLLQIVSYLTAKHAGMKNFGVIFGVITSLVALGSGLGLMIAGMVFDVTGKYDGFLIVGAVASVFCGLLIWLLPREPDWRRLEAVKA